MAFLSSFFQKRVLRYALSRLDVVDTEALDLDSLGIRWGQRSTVELRDVGLKLEVSARDQSFGGGAIFTSPAYQSMTGFSHLCLFE